MPSNEITIGPLEETGKQLAESTDISIGSIEEVGAPTELATTPQPTGGYAPSTGITGIPSRLLVGAPVRGIATGIGGLAKTAEVLFGIDTESFQEAAKTVEEAATPKEPSKVPFIGTIESGTVSTGQAAVLGAPGAVIGAGTHPVVGFAASAGLTFGSVEYHDFMKDIEDTAVANGATPEEIAKAKEAVKKYAVISGSLEGGGEALTAGMAWAGGGLLRAPVKAVVKPIIKNTTVALAKMAGIALTEITGEEVTTVGEYGAKGAAYNKLREMFPNWSTPEQPSLSEQMKQTAGTTLVQFLEMVGIAALFRGKGKVRVADIRKETVAKKVDELAAKYNISGETATTAADELVAPPVEERAARAIKVLDEKITKTRKKKTTAEKVVEDVKVAEKAATVVPEGEPEQWGLRPPLEIVTTPTPAEVTPTEVTPTKVEKQKKARKPKKELVVLVVNQDDLAAAGIEVAAKVGVPIADVTTEQVMEVSGVDKTEAKAIINTAIRSKKGWNVGEALSTPSVVVEPAPTEVKEVTTPTVPTMETSDVVDGIVNKEGKQVGANKVVPALNDKAGKVYFNEGATVHALIGVPESIVDEMTAGWISFGKFKTKLSKEDLAGNREVGDSFAYRPKVPITEGQAIEAQAVPEPRSVQELNIVDVAKAKELVAGIKKIGGGDFYKMIERLVNPREEGMTPTEVATIEGIDELFNEAGVPDNMRIAAVKAVALDAGVLTGEDLALERLSTSVEFDTLVGQEYDKLVDGGRLAELENLGMTEEQIDVALEEEAKTAAELKMQGKYNVVEEDISDHEVADVESAQIEAELTSQAIEESVSSEVDEEVTVEAPTEFKTKREALAERNKKDSPESWAINKVAERKWSLSRTTPAIVESVDKAIVGHPLYQTKKEADAAVAVLQQMGRAPDKFTNTRAFLDSIRAAISSTYYNKGNIKEVFPVLNTLLVDLKQQSGKFDGDTKTIKELVEYAGQVSSYATKVAESFNLKPGFPVETIVEQEGRYTNYLDMLQQDVQNVQRAGIVYTAKNWVEKVVNSRFASPYSRKVLGDVLNDPLLANALDKVGVDLANKTNIGTSYYNPKPNYITFSKQALENRDIGNSTLHEVWHALTSNALYESPEFNDAITRLREEALSYIPAVDADILMTINTQQFIEYAKVGALYTSYEEGGLGLSDPTLYNIYYGLLDNFEFISMSCENSQFQEFLSFKSPTAEKGAIPYTPIWKRLMGYIHQYVLRSLGMNEVEQSMLGEVIKTTTLYTEMYWKDTPSNLDSPRRTSAMARRDVMVEAKHYDKTHMKMDDILSAIQNKEIVMPRKQPRDASFLSEWIVSPEAVKAVMEDPRANEMAGMAIDSVDSWHFKRSIGFEELDRIRGNFSETERVEITKVMKRVESGTPLSQIKAPDNIKEAAGDLFKLQESYRERMKENKRTLLIRSLNQTSQRIFHDVLIKGEDVNISTKKWNSYARKVNAQRSKFIKAGNLTNLPNREAITTYAAVRASLKEYVDIGSWGFDNYVTHAMKGNIVITQDINGKHVPVSVGETTKQALDRAIDILRNSKPDESPQLFIETDFHLDREMTQLVSTRQYQAIKSRVMRAMKTEAAELQLGLNKAAANKVLNKVFSIKPRNIWNQFTQERENVLLGEEDIFTIMPSYVHMMEKEMALSPYIQYFRKHIDEFNNRPHIKAILEQQLERSKGKYWKADELADSAMRQLGLRVGEARATIQQWLGKKNAIAIPPEWSEKPFTASRFVRRATSLEANAKLGFRPVASIVNLASGMGHVWVKTSLKYMYNAVKILQTDEGQAFMKKYAPNLGTSLASNEAGIKSNARWWTPLGTFQKAETPNREMSFVATYLMGRDEGLSEVAAVEFAKRGVRLQQFNYNIASLPRILTGPGGKLIGQFKSYLVKEIEFIRTLTPGEWVKYLGVQLALGGPRGMMITIKSLPPLIIINALINGMRGGGDWLDDMDEWMNVNLPRFSRGVFGYFGIDASGPASFQFPTDIKSWFSVSVSDVINFGKEVAIPFMKGEEYVKWGLWKASKQAIPIWKIWSEMMFATYHDDWIWDDQGKKMYKIEGITDWIKAAGGFKPLRWGIAQLQNRIIADQIKEEQDRANNIVLNAVMSRKRLGDDGVVQKIVIDCMTYKVSPDSLISAMKQSEIEPGMRSVLKAKLASRLDVWQRQRAAARAIQGVP